MSNRSSLLTLALAALGLAAPGPADAQISGRVIIQEGPIGVDVVFGPRPSVVVEHVRTAPRYEPRPRHEPRRPVRYHRGMTLVELESYRAWIEDEYRYFRRLHPDDAYHHFGWSEWELDAYVDWLKDERKSVKKEHKRLRKLLRDRGRWDGAGRGRGSRGRGRG